MPSRTDKLIEEIAKQVTLIQGDFMDILAGNIPEQIKSNEDYAKQLAQICDENNMVFKVERKLPRLARGEDPSLYTFKEGIDCIIKAGYVAIAEMEMPK